MTYGKNYNGPEKIGVKPKKIDIRPKKIDKGF